MLRKFIYMCFFIPTHKGVGIRRGYFGAHSSTSYFVVKFLVKSYYRLTLSQANRLGKYLMGSVRNPSLGLGVVGLDDGTAFLIGYI